MIANARMYALNDAVAAMWKRLFEWVAGDAGVSLDVIAHPPPLPLGDLWRRDDLGCALMCGFPWATWSSPRERPVPLAVPILAPPIFEDRPIYWTDIVVRADSPFASAGDLAGARFAFTVEDSQSGYQAPRRFFAERARAAGERLFRAAVGPLYTPRRVVEAIIGGDADAGPLDAWWHALLRRHEPEIAARLRVVATTPPAPIPLFVSAAAMPDAEKDRLSAAFEKISNARELADIRDALLLKRFTRPTPDDYLSLVEGARQADALGYDRLQ
ncbi:MAG TPA: PhnD/SsuA/transferrin family substrate-binding protein [Casimicrobiaceae bacterium]|jgi:ABC-type phosphate/phosphonate transport system substrate-binding protein